MLAVSCFVKILVGGAASTYTSICDSLLLPGGQISNDNYWTEFDKLWFVQNIRINLKFTLYGYLFDTTYLFKAWLPINTVYIINTTNVGISKLW